MFETGIDGDILNPQIPLYLTNDRTVTAGIYASGTYSLNSSQLQEAKTYQHLIFNGMLGRLISAAKLRDKIAKEFHEYFLIQPSLAMEALTTRSCLESFSSEGLELLVDSFLKYATSRYLYLVFDKKHKGQLVARRCRLICNENLHNLVMKRQLSGHIQDEPFQLDYWYVPKMLCA